MRAADRIEGDINARATRSACRQSTHGSNEVTCLIVDGRSAEALDYRQIRGRTGADRL